MIFMLKYFQTEKYLEYSVAMRMFPQVFIPNNYKFCFNSLSNHQYNQTDDFVTNLQYLYLSMENQILIFVTFFFVDKLQTLLQQLFFYRPFEICTKNVLLEHLFPCLESHSNVHLKRNRVRITQGVALIQFMHVQKYKIVDDIQISVEKYKKGSNVLQLPFILIHN